MTKATVMFRRDESGSIAAIFGLTLPLLMAGVAGAVEVTRAMAYKERLTSVTELACNQGATYVAAQRKVSLLKDYTQDVKNIVTTNVTEKQLAAVTVATPVLSLTNVHVANAGTLAFYLGAFLPQSGITFNVARDCLLPPDPAGPSQIALSESFETSGTATNSWDVLKNWNNWTTTNAGIEINGMRSLASNTMVDGNFFAELDSDCNTYANRGLTNCHSNSGMTKTLTLSAGPHQISYYYMARHGYINTSAYGTQPICSDLTKAQGSPRADFASQSSTSSTIRAAEGDGETFRIEVYVDNPGDTLFSANNLVDACIWADTWTVRKINLTINTAGDYRFSWRAAGREDTYGGLIDSLKVCKGVCP